MDVTLLTPLYLGSRQVKLRDVRDVRTLADLKGGDDTGAAEEGDGGVRGSVGLQQRGPAQGRGADHRLLQGPGPDGDPPDVDAFRKAVQVAYAGSDMAKAWPKGLLERINAAHWSRSVPQHFKRAADALGVALFGVWAWAIAQALRGQGLGDAGLPSS